MMKNVWVTIVLLAVVFGGFIWFINFNPPKSRYERAETFNVSTKKMTEDLQVRPIPLPQGQVWGFTPDQKVNLQILQTKHLDNDVVAVAVKTAASHSPSPYS